MSGARRATAVWVALAFGCMPAWADVAVPSTAAEIASPVQRVDSAQTGAADQVSETGAEPVSVFYVQRNKNAKEVHYGLRLDSACRAASEQPMYNYWVRPTTAGPVTEPLSFFQQAGYGLESQKVSDGRIEVVLKALPGRPIVLVPSLQSGRCRVLVHMQIAGRPSIFEKAYVFAEEGLFLPTVKYIDLFGRAEDGAPVTERVVPN
jgi:hypothetical protein